MEPDAETLTWVREALGAFRVASDFAHPHGGARLWRLAAGSDHAWLKLNPRPHKWACEVHALANWREPLMPRLIASRPGAVLMTECEGEGAEALTGIAAERMWTEAGAWLQRLHARTGPWFGNVSSDGTPHGEVSTDPTFQLTKTFTARVRTRTAASTSRNRRARRFRRRRAAPSPSSPTRPASATSSSSSTPTASTPGDRDGRASHHP